MDRKEYSKIYYEIHKEEYHQRYLRRKEEIKKRNERNKEIKQMYDHLRNLNRWEEKAEYNRQYYLRRKANDKN